MFDIGITIIENAIYAFITFSLINIKAKKECPFFLLLWGTLTVLTLVSNHLEAYDILLEPLTILMICVLSSIFSYNRKSYILMISIVPSIINNVIVTVSVFMISFVLRRPAITILSEYYVLVACLTKSVFLILGILIYHYRDSIIKFSEYRFKEWWPMIVLSYGILFSFNILFSVLINQSIRLEYTMFMVFINMITAFMVLIMFYNLQKSSKEKYDDKLKLALFHNDMEAYKQMQELEEAIRKSRHDEKYRYSYMYQLVEQGDIEALKKALKERVDEVNTWKYYRFSNQTIFNMVLNERIAKMEDLKIQFDYDIRVPETLAMEEMDLYRILSNLMDNAIENCSGEKRIVMKAWIVQNALRVVIKNTIDQSVLQDNPDLKTKKEDIKHHGHGLDNTRKIAELYMGSLLVEEDDGYFVSDVICCLRAIAGEEEMDD